MTKKTQFRIFIGIIFSVVVIYYSAKSLGGLNPGVLFQLKINWWLAIASAALFAYSNYVRALAYTRGIDRNIDRMSAFRIVGIGHSANMVLPLHAGEGLRFPFFPSSYSPAERTRLVLIPGIADFAAILILSILAVPFAGFRNPALLHALDLITLIFFGILALLIVIVSFIPRLRKYFVRYLNRDMLEMSFWVFLSWIIMLVSMWLGLIAFGFPFWNSFRMTLAVFAATNIISFIPATPGGIGLFEYGAVLGMGGLGIAALPAKNAGLLLHLIQYIAMLPLGAALYLTSLKGKRIRPPRFSEKRRRGRGILK